MSAENKQVDIARIEKAVGEILLAVGEDPKREGLGGTPKRVANMYAELLAGMHDNPTVQRSVDSTLTTILGRQAARRNTMITWDEMIKRTKGLKWIRPV